VLEVITVPNQRRPRVGRAPTGSTQRPWLPQHARHCPVLEAGSALGLLVFPPLRDNEAFQVRYLQDNSYRFSFYVTDATGQAELIFAVGSKPSAGGGGQLADELIFRSEKHAVGDAEMRALRDALLTNLDTPPGVIGVRGAVDFKTPEGWDTVYTGVTNQTQPPHIPVLTVRVQTDWFAHNSEFRYVLQPGDVLSASGTSPVGQVFFLPREEIKLVAAGDEQVAAFRAAQQTFWEEKAGDTLVAPYGIAYSPRYRKVSRHAT